MTATAIEPGSTLTVRRARRLPFGSKHASDWTLGLAAASVVAFLYLPIVMLIIFSFNDNKLTTWPLAGFTWHWYHDAFSNKELLAALSNSFYVAVIATALCVAIGVPAAFALDRINFPGKLMFRRLVLLPLVLPGIVTGISMMIMFTKVLGMPLSLQTVILGHATALVSVVATQVFARLQRFNRRMEEASADLGAKPLQTFWMVTLPNIRSAILGSALLSFTLSFDEIPVTYFLTGRDNTLPMYIYSTLRRGITPEINAIGSVIVLASLVLIVLSIWLLERSRRAGRQITGPKGQRSGGVSMAQKKPAASLAATSSAKAIEALRRRGTRTVHLGIFDNDACFRSKRLPLAVAESAFRGEYTFVNVLPQWDIGENVIDPNFNFVDEPIIVDPSSGRWYPFEPDAALYIGSYGGPSAALSPRALLAEQIARAAKLGFDVKAAVECEFTVMAETAESVRAKGYANLTPALPDNRCWAADSSAPYAAFCADLENLLNEMGIPIYALGTELGPGCLEATLVAEEPLRAADSEALFRQMTKAFCRQRGMTATFMARSATGTRVSPATCTCRCRSQDRQAALRRGQVEGRHQPAGAQVRRRHSPSAARLDRALHAHGQRLPPHGAGHVGAAHADLGGGELCGRGPRGRQRPRDDAHRVPHPRRRHPSAPRAGLRAGRRPLGDQERRHAAVAARGRRDDTGRRARPAARSARGDAAAERQQAGARDLGRAVRRPLRHVPVTKSDLRRAVSGGELPLSGDVNLSVRAAGRSRDLEAYLATPGRADLVQEVGRRSRRRRRLHLLPVHLDHRPHHGQGSAGRALGTDLAASGVQTWMGGVTNVLPTATAR